MSSSRADLGKPGCPCPTAAAVSALMLEVTIQHVFSAQLYLSVTNFLSFYKSLNKACVGCLVSYRHVGVSILPFSELPRYAHDLAAQVGLARLQTLAGSPGEKRWRRRPGFLDHRTRGAAKRWHQLWECWRGCFVKAHGGSEGRPVLHQTVCCLVGDLLVIYLPYPLQINPHVQSRLVNGKM